MFVLKSLRGPTHWWSQGSPPVAMFVVPAACLVLCVCKLPFHVPGWWDFCILHLSTNRISDGNKFCAAVILWQKLFNIIIWWIGFGFIIDLQTFRVNCWNELVVYHYVDCSAEVGNDRSYLENLDMETGKNMINNLSIVFITLVFLKQVKWCCCNR